jgi:hypothetical protein
MLKALLIAALVLLSGTVHADQVSWILVGVDQQGHQKNVPLSNDDVFFKDGNWQCSINAAQPTTDLEDKPSMVRFIFCINTVDGGKRIAGTTYNVPILHVVTINNHAYHLECR